MEFLLYEEALELVLWEHIFLCVCLSFFFFFFCFLFVLGSISINSYIHWGFHTPIILLIFCVLSQCNYNYCLIQHDKSYTLYFFGSVFYVVVHYSIIYMQRYNWNGLWWPGSLLMAVWFITNHKLLTSPPPLVFVSNPAKPSFFWFNIRFENLLTGSNQCQEKHIWLAFLCLFAYVATGVNLLEECFH